MTVTMNGEVYDKIKDAVFAAESGQTIALDGNMTEDVEIVGGKKLILDLKGFKLDNVAAPTIRVMRNAVLTIIDSSKEGTGVVDSKITKMPAIQVDPGSIFTMEAGKLTRSKEDGSANTAFILNNLGFTNIGGKVNITGTSTKNAVIKNGFDTKDEADMYLYGQFGPGYIAKMLVKGGTIVGVKSCIRNDEFAQLNITDGNITCENECIYNWTSCTVTGGTISSSAKSPFISGSYNGSGGAVFVSGGNINAFAGQPIFAEVPMSDVILKPRAPEVSGGTFSAVFPEEYLVSGYVFGGAGGLQVIPGSWEFMDAGVSGVGFSGHRRLIVHKDKVKYEVGGLAVPAPIGAATLLSVNVKGGAFGYYDQVAGKVLLYRGGKELTANDIEDITLVFLEF